jgi:hypothetical protein
VTAEYSHAIDEDDVLCSLNEELAQSFLYEFLAFLSAHLASYFPLYAVRNLCWTDVLTFGDLFSTNYVPS